MDHESLRTASTYLNNLLLARGLLRNGEPIDFVKPSKESRAQIINLVHDLILREDRDREQREHVAITIRTLRAEEMKNTAEITRLKVKQEESARAEVQARTTERAAQAEIKKTEKAMKGLQDQITKLKTTLAQVKTQCANDVRKRDLELARLKTHLQGQQRGNRAATSAPSITISHAVKGRAPADHATHELDDAEYSLKQETTEFLTRLSQSLSDENDDLISLIRESLSQMKELLGLPANAVRTHPDSAMGSMGSNEDKHAQDMLHTLPTSYETLATDLKNTLVHIQGVLSNPNFVSVEEVEMREEEILRLREGWDRMERRWKEVLIMMNGWLSKVNTGGTINVEDVRRGVGLVSPAHDRQSHTQMVADSADSSLLSGEGDVSEIKLPEYTTDESSIVLEPPSLTSLIAQTRPNDGSQHKTRVGEPSSSCDSQPRSTLSTAVPENQSDRESEGARRLTVAEKLSAAQSEADEATAAKAATKDEHSVDTRTAHADPETLENGHGQRDPAEAAEEEADTLGNMPDAKIKRSKMRGRPRRRKSTLSPEELEALIASTGEHDEL